MKHGLLKRIFSVLITTLLLINISMGICTISAVANDEEDVEEAVEEAVESGAYVIFGKPIKTDRAQAKVSTEVTDCNFAYIEEREGRYAMVTTQYRTADNRNAGITYIPFLVDDSYISPQDRHVAVNVTYFDRDYDSFRIYYYKENGSIANKSISKNGTNTWRTTSVLLDNPVLSGQIYPKNSGVAGDIWITSVDKDIIRVEELISKVEFVNLDKTFSDPKAMYKTDVLHTSEAYALSSMGLLESFKDDGKKYGLDKPITLEQAVVSVVRLAYGGTEELAGAVCTASDVSEEAKPYVGLALSKGIIKELSNGSIGAGTYVTLKDLLNMFILAVENNGYTDYGEETLQRAETLKIVADVDDHFVHGSTGVRVYQDVPGLLKEETADIDRLAYMDDLAGISYNMMSVTISGEMKPVMAQLYERGVFTQENLVKSGCRKLLETFYRQTGFRLVEDSYVDKTTGVTINTLTLPGLCSNGGYSHSQGLSADGRYIVACVAVDESTDYGVIVLYDRETKETKPLHPEMKTSYNYGFMLCAQTNEVVYTCGRELYCYDINTGTNRLVATQDVSLSEVWCGVPSLTADGELVALFGSDAQNRMPMNIDTINIRTGEIEKTLVREEVAALTTDSERWTISNINHININPVYKNLYYYVRHNSLKEGYTGTAPQELWTYNSDTKEHTLLYRWHLNENYTADESVAHWVWSGDGELNYFIKYYSSDYITELPGHGIVSVTKGGNEDATISAYYNGDYGYNHVAATPDGKYFVGDDSTQWSGKQYVGKVVLVDGETGKSRLLANDLGMWKNHPGHTHPLISDDGGTVYFTMANANSQLQVGYIDLKNLPEINPDDYKVASIELGNNLVEKGIVKYDEFIDRAAYSKLITKVSTIEGKSCLEIPKGNNNPFDVYASYIDAAESVVTMQIEYLDNGTDPIVVGYNSNHLGEIAKTRDNTKYSFKRTGTNQWLTHEFTITDASFRSAQEGIADFNISAESSSVPVYIKSIRAAAGTEIPEGFVEGQLPDYSNNSIKAFPSVKAEIEIPNELVGEEPSDYSDTSVKAFSSEEESLIKVKGSYTKDATSPDGIKCVKLSGNQLISFALNDKIPVKHKEAISIAVTYFDLGKGTINLEYNAKDMLCGVPESKDYMPYQINRTGTNQWKTAIIELSNADFKGRQIDGADFRIISSNSVLPIYIKQVELLTE